MNIISVHIDETLDDKDINDLKQALTVVPHILNVELNSFVPHDLMVEFEEHYNMPVTILDKLSKQGLHSDIQAC